jgi:hypothetical protein
MTIFQSFRSTVNGFVRGQRAANYNVLADPITGSPVGLQHTNGSGPDGIWVPIDLTAGQIASPTAEMIADLNAVFRLNVAPYTRYQSNGTTLVAVSAAGNATLSATQTFTGNNTFSGTTTATTLVATTSTVTTETVTTLAATTATVSGVLTSSGTLVVATATPASAAAAGTAGTIAWDTGFLYVCTATNTWCRVAIATWP